MEKFQHFISLMEFIATFFHCVRRNLPRFLQKLSFDKNLAEKPKILCFRNDIWVLFISSSGYNINFPNFQIPLYFFSRVILSSRGEQARNWAQSLKTQNFKVLRFKPNFRGRLNMTNEVTPWPHSIKKHLKNGFIHDSSEEHAFPQILSLNHIGSSKFSPMVSKFRELISNLF